MKVAVIHVLKKLITEHKKDLLHEISKEIKKSEKKPDIILLPGGYFISDTYMGECDFDERKKILEKQSFSKELKSFSKNMEAVIVAGIDTGRDAWKAKGDQMCVAWNETGVLGIGRKVWTVNGDEGQNYHVNFDDFGTSHRLVKIKNKKILLCSCYDGYGTEGNCAQQNNRLKNTKNIFFDHKLLKKDISELKEKGKKKWNDLLDKADMAVISIHNFSNEGFGSGKGYWTRGIRARSKKDNKDFAIFGASHFENMDMGENANRFSAKNGIDLNIKKEIRINNGKVNTAIIRFYEI